MKLSAFAVVPLCFISAVRGDVWSPASHVREKTDEAPGRVRKFIRSPRNPFEDDEALQVPSQPQSSTTVVNVEPPARRNLELDAATRDLLVNEVADYGFGMMEEAVVKGATIVATKVLHLSSLATNLVSFGTGVFFSAALGKLNAHPSFLLCYVSSLSSANRCSFRSNRWFCRHHSKRGEVQLALLLRERGCWVMVL